MLIVDHEVDPKKLTLLLQDPNGLHVMYNCTWVLSPLLALSACIDI